MIYLSHWSVLALSIRGNNLGARRRIGITFGTLRRSDGTYTLIITKSYGPGPHEAS